MPAIVVGYDVVQAPLLDVKPVDVRRIRRALAADHKAASRCIRRRSRRSRGRQTERSRRVEDCLGDVVAAHGLGVLEGTDKVLVKQRRVQIERRLL